MQEPFPGLGIQKGSIERLELNPFPEILSPEEFKEAVKAGNTYFSNYMQELDQDAHEQLNKDQVYEAVFTRFLQKEFATDFTQGKVTEDFSDTVLLEDPTAITGEPRKIVAMQNAFKELKTFQTQNSEEVSPADLFELYQDDLMGRTIIRSIAIEKVRGAARKLGEEDVRDLVATDVGVFAPDKNIQVILPPDDFNDPVKPTHRWLRKPSTEAAMKEMLQSISGRKITIIVAVAMRYRVVKNGPDTYRWQEVEFSVPIKKLTNNEIANFVQKYFARGKYIAGGVDYTSFGSELVEGGITLPYESIVTPVKEIKKLWAQVQVIKRAAHLHSKKMVAKPKKEGI